MANQIRNGNSHKAISIQESTKQVDDGNTYMSNIATDDGKYHLSNKTRFNGKGQLAIKIFTVVGFLIILGWLANYLVANFTSFR